ncbi:TIGR03086 family metal-binding protein [Streptomyces sp. NPDC059262]|uniref:TIGR03086 family metal-binding protein n=1 Tax=Streptomyces sp. NPDC059262 TaxID=3346797 RepID=UPI0036915F44
MKDIDGNNGGPGTPRGIGDLLDVAVQRAVPVVSALPDGRLEAATPCADFDVKALVNHLFQVMEQFQRLAAKQDSDFTESADRVAEGPDWRERFGEEARKLVAAWSAPGAEEGTTGAMNMPAATVGSMVLLDLTVHIWDLARATGQEYVPEGEASLAVVERLSGTVAELAPTARSMGVFGEAVPEPAGASALERLLAATGRDPRWAAPVS